jgi:hypothetical protein
VSPREVKESKAAVAVSGIFALKLRKLCQSKLGFTDTKVLLAKLLQKLVLATQVNAT